MVNPGIILKTDLPDNNKYWLELEKLVSGSRTKELTTVEINGLFTFIPNPYFNQLLYTALQKGLLDSLIALLQIIRNFRSKEYLTPLALCLRSGVDVNTYVTINKQLPNVHLLVYVFVSMININVQLTNIVLIMLIIKGSRLIDNALMKTEQGPILTARQWINQKNPNTIISGINGEDDLDKKSTAIKNIYIVLDIYSNEYLYDEDDYYLAIKSLSHTVFEKLTPSPSKFLTDYTDLSLAVIHVNSYAYRKLIEATHIPSYILLSDIIVAMKITYQLQYLEAFQKLKEMLWTSISIGLSIDEYQENVIKLLGNETIKEFTGMYFVPYYKKICTLPAAPVPYKLRKLAHSLGIDPDLSREFMCKDINSLIAKDDQIIIKAAQRRQQYRIASELLPVDAFIKDNPEITFRNGATLREDPLDYNDLDVLYYRDLQGANWIFTRDQFENLLETKVNPYNSIALPEYFIIKIKMRLYQLQKLTYNSKCDNTIISFSQALSRLKEKDIIDPKCDDIIDAFFTAANKYDVTISQIKNTSKERIVQLLNGIGYPVDLTNVSNLWIVKIIANIILRDQISIELFFTSLKE